MDGPDSYDAVIIVSFGGPEAPDEVIPFLERVLAGRDVPRARLEAVAGHYHQFGGVSPINAHNRALVAALGKELATAGLDLPVFWGNRNWHPLVADELTRMRDAGVRRALAFVTSAYGSYSSCRQYLEDLATARAAVGERAPAVDKLRLFFNHPAFVACWADSVRAARRRAGADAPVLFSAHSIPVRMAATSPYQAQLVETARLVAEEAGLDDGGWSLVWQSRSGPPGQPWLEPDVGDALAAAAGRGEGAVVVAPIGFVSDHMEVVYDLDTVAAERAASLGIRMVRAATPATAPAIDARFVAMVRQLVEERVRPGTPRLAVGRLPPAPDGCAAGCCPPSYPGAGPGAKRPPSS